MRKSVCDDDDSNQEIEAGNSMNLTQLRASHVSTLNACLMRLAVCLFLFPETIKRQ
jgi:hypothetical protein